MNLRQITPTYTVSPQIEPSDLPAIRAAGFVRVICNRPDAENPPSHQAAAMAEAAEAAGIDFVVLPLTHDTMTPENVALQMDLAENAGGPVLAYCASGTRCSVIWSLGQASQGTATADEILEATARAGYDLSGLRPRLMQILG
ncbi:TIGR01244 family phosphatase [Pseudooceanicola sp. CBS1P-1]|uniref:TIGR01244 family phosphatase n=1 Tax=Pseudooceanicola albus TaxID=2692189 RepID=A0A6L7G6Q4_9RHOB|nr:MULTISPECIES: TIGR01244 family sulfur transferase [Pseudooceanicola]MBT9385522.1 TIGR01244 family phosphatase [Pseudooceanicola endophyticus]MXN19066.1 TIGR01244 family phosphatase [Pseudooceanicola albus]